MGGSAEQNPLRGGVRYTWKQGYITITDEAKLFKISQVGVSYKFLSLFDTLNIC